MMAARRQRRIGAGEMAALVIGIARLDRLADRVVRPVIVEHAAGALGEILDQPADRHLGEGRSEEHTSELQSLMRISYAVFCLKKKTKTLTSRQKVRNKR